MISKGPYDNWFDVLALNAMYMSIDLAITAIVVGGVTKLAGCW